MHRLGEPCEGDQRGRIRDLRGLVQKDADIFQSEDLLDALLVVEAADPDAGFIRQLEETVLPVLLQLHARKAEPHDIGQRIERDGRARRIGVEAQDRMPRMRRCKRPRDDGLNDEKGFARARAAGKTGIALRRFKKTPRAFLARAESHHARPRLSCLETKRPPGWGSLWKRTAHGCGAVDARICVANHRKVNRSAKGCFALSYLDRSAPFIRSSDRMMRL